MAYQKIFHRVTWKHFQLIICEKMAGHNFRKARNVPEQHALILTPVVFDTGL